MALWRLTKHNAVLETLGQTVHYIINATTDLALLDNMKTLKRTKWKAYRWKERLKTYGNYLDLWRLNTWKWAVQTPYPGGFAQVDVPS